MGIIIGNLELEILSWKKWRGFVSVSFQVRKNPLRKTRNELAIMEMSAGIC